MPMSRILLGFLLMVPSLAAQTILPPFNQHYSWRSVGRIHPAHPTYGGITLHHSNPDVLLFAPFGTMAIWAVPLSRDSAGHIVGLGSPTFHASAGDRLDGGLAYSPTNVLFHTTNPSNTVGQMWPGFTFTNRVEYLGSLSGNTFASVGTCAFVPPGYPGAGQFKVLSWSTADWRSVNLRLEANGLYRFLSLSAARHIGGGPEGIVYPPPGSPAWPDSSRVLIADLANSQIRALPIDGNGDPLLAGAGVMMINVAGVGGGTVDSVTGDLLFTWRHGELLQIRLGNTCGAFRSYGRGGAGLNGVPTLSGAGCARLAGTITVSVGSGRPGAFGAMLVGFAERNTPVYNFTLLNDSAIVAPHVLDASGSHALPVTVPATVAFAGSDAYFQGGYSDAAAPFGISATQGLHVHID